MFDFNIKTPSDEDVKKESIELAQNNPNRFSAWYPAVKNVVDTPKTSILSMSYELVSDILDNRGSDEAMQEIKRLSDEVHAFAKVHGYPVFLKNGLFSAKHDWQNTCCVSEGSNVIANIAGIVARWGMVGATPSFELVVRKMIDTIPAFHAFYGEMPITREFRFFSSAENVVSYQPYWPEGAIERQSVDVDNWRELLASMNQLTPLEKTELIAKASLVASKLSGEWPDFHAEKSDSWSIDFLQDKHGNWWLIDVAQAHESYKMNDHEGLVAL